MSLKNIICSDDRLSQGQDIGYCCEMRAFWHSSESLAPSVPLPEVRPDGGPGRLFSFLFGIPDLASIAVWWGGWSGMTCFVPCSAAKPRHNLLWLAYCMQEACSAAKQMVSKWMFLLFLHHIGPGVAGFSHPSLFRTLMFFSTHNKNLEENSVRIHIDHNLVTQMVSPLFPFLLLLGGWCVSCPFSLGFDLFNIDWNSQPWIHQTHID